MHAVVYDRITVHGHRSAAYGNVGGRTTAAQHKAEYQGQHDNPRAGLPMAKQSEQCQRRDYD
jgi:hypothetical protein